MLSTIFGDIPDVDRTHATADCCAPGLVEYYSLLRAADLAHREGRSKAADRLACAAADEANAYEIRLHPALRAVFQRERIGRMLTALRAG